LTLSKIGDDHIDRAITIHISHSHTVGAFRPTKGKGQIRTEETLPIIAIDPALPTAIAHNDVRLIVWVNISYGYTPDRVVRTAEAAHLVRHRTVDWASVK